MLRCRVVSGPGRSAPAPPPAAAAYSPSAARAPPRSRAPAPAVPSPHLRHAPAGSGAGPTAAAAGGVHPTGGLPTSSGGGNSPRARAAAAAAAGGGMRSSSASSAGLARPHPNASTPGSAMHAPPTIMVKAASAAQHHAHAHSPYLLSALLGGGGAAGSSSPTASAAQSATQLGAAAAAAAAPLLDWCYSAAAAHNRMALYVRSLVAGAPRYVAAAAVDMTAAAGSMAADQQARWQALQERMRAQLRQRRSGGALGDGDHDGSSSEEYGGEEAHGGGDGPPLHPAIRAALRSAHAGPVGAAGAGAAAAAAAAAGRVGESAAATAAQQKAEQLLLLAPFVSKASLAELCTTAVISDLCNMAYEADKVTVESLKAQGHVHLSLIATSARPQFGPATRKQHAGAEKRRRRANTKDGAAAAVRGGPASGAAAGGLGQQQQHAVATMALHVEPAAAVFGGGGAGPCVVLPDHPEDTSMEALLQLADHSAEVCIEKPQLQCAPGATGRGSLAFVPKPQEYSGSPDVEHAILMEELIESIEEILSSEEMVSMEDEGQAPGSDDHLNAFSLADVPTYGSMDEEEWQPPVPALPQHPMPERGGMPAGGQAFLASVPTYRNATPEVSGNGGAPPGGDVTSRNNLIEQEEPPAAWFVADDPVDEIRYFILQGSTSLQHWTINLSFEPVVFEDASLGVRVHRGVYEAALRLYDDLVPLVRQHVSGSPFATLAFAGHSLGGSLGTILTLLLVHRGVIPPSRVHSCHTFGAPAVFCTGGGGGMNHDGVHAHNQQQAQQQQAGEGPAGPPGQPADAHHHRRPGARAGSPGRGARRGSTGSACLLERLGIPESKLVNVMMHRDVVPRAFVCDYNSVAGLLQRWMPSFKDHSSLCDQRRGGHHKHLYNFLGRTAVLKPRDDAEFVRGDNAHAMLPDAPGLYLLAEPPQRQAQAARLPASPAPADAGASAGADAAPPVVPSPARAGGGGAAAAATALQPPRPALTLRAAVLQFMNHPHPLKILSQLESYGTDGAISRYHNPNNYTIGLAGLESLARLAAN
ncbi:hypothetical protein FOA52_005710 [Chlamydomonas sp. UWO 241]|nr:hypothetical protein FOA52_005710 [Chlamydomonas sp. UWO 241]